MAKYWLVASILEFCPEGNLKFSWPDSGPTNATHTVQEATGCQECTIGLVLYEITQKPITPAYLLKALTQLTKSTDANSWHHQMLVHLVHCAKKPKVATNASASANHSDSSIGRVLPGQETGVRGFCIVDCDQLQPMPTQAECVTASGAGVACRAPITLEQRIACYRKAIEANTKGPRNADDSLVEGRPYEELLAQWRNSCQRLRGVSLQDANMSLTRTINSSGMMYNTASSDNVLTRENVSSPSVQSLVDQMLQLIQNLQKFVKLQTLAKGVVDMQAPTGEQIAKHSADKTAFQSPLSSLQENPSQGSTEGGKRGGDIGGGGKIAGASLQTYKKRKLLNETTAHMNPPHIARETRSSVRKAASNVSWIMEAVEKAEAQKVDVQK